MSRDNDKLAEVRRIVAAGVDAAIAVEELAKLLGTHLRGLPPEIQGAALADVLAMWLAGHAPPLRAKILRKHVETVERLIPLNEKLIFGEEGHPYGRGKN